MTPFLANARIALLLGVVIAATGGWDSQARAQVEFNPNRHSLAVSDDESLSDTTQTTSQRPKPQKTLGFAKYSKRFQQWCRLLDKDGRREGMFIMLDYLSDEAADCPGCRAFFRSFAAPCKPRRLPPKKKSVTDDSQAKDPKQQPKQREPSTELLDAISSGMIEMRDDEKRAGDAALAIQRLVAELRHVQTKTAGERDYFDILSSYFYAPMASLLVTPAAVASTGGGDESLAAEPPQVDDLFSF